MDNKKEIFGSFQLSGTEFALSVLHVQEVINPPERYSPMPLAPDYLCGLFNLRGTIIPVVDLRKILHLAEDEKASERKVAVVDMEGHLMGLLFDKTGEIFTSRPEERNDFTHVTKKSVISGVFKKENGKRLIQILDVAALFELHDIPRSLGETVKRGRKEVASPRGARKQCISFTIGPANCAMGIDEIQEILKIDKMDSPALAQEFCLGVIDLRGTTIPVIDFAALLDYRPVDKSENATLGDRRIMVLKLDKEVFGLLVDSVGSIVTYFQEDLKAFPVLSRERQKMFRGCISRENGEDILLLDHSGILSDREISEITRGHSKLYQAKNQLVGDGMKSAAGARRTFITFVVEGQYAVRIEDVREIIEYPAELLRPPGLPSFCDGVLNLRGEMVTIVDARILYKRDKAPNVDRRVLIFKKDGLSFGLVVDSVESIASFSEADKVKLPELLYRHAGLAEDIAEAIQTKGSGGKPVNILVLSVDSIAKRVGAA